MGSNMTPPSCLGDRQITRVPNIPGSFSVLLDLRNVYVKPVKADSFFLGFEHCAFSYSSNLYNFAAIGVSGAQASSWAACLPSLATTDSYAVLLISN